MIYFTSDLHFWHKNAILYSSAERTEVSAYGEPRLLRAGKTVRSGGLWY